MIKLFLIILLILIPTLSPGDIIKERCDMIFSTQDALNVVTIKKTSKKTIDFNLKQIVKNVFKEYRFPELSPDGKYIVFGYRDIRKISENKYYFLVKLDIQNKSTAIILKSSSEHFEYPSYSPDGRFLAFVSYSNAYEDNFNAKIMLYNIKQNRIQKVIENIYPFNKPTWSPNGQLLVFITRDMKISIYDVITGRQKIIDVKGKSPIFSPDGRKVFYIGIERKANKVYSLELQKLISKEELKEQDELFEKLVSFSKDGKYLLVIKSGSKLMLPGYEFFKLELIDFKNKESFEIYKGGIMRGATWTGEICSE